MSPPHSSKRKIQDVVPPEALADPDNSSISKKLCADEVGTSASSDKDKENMPKPSFKHENRDAKVSRAASMNDSTVFQRKCANADLPVSGVSVAARAALFENAISKSGGTLPLKRASARPPLKHTFSALNVVAARAGNGPSVDSTITRMSTSLDEESNQVPADAGVTPPMTGNMRRPFRRPGTPKKPELPDLSIMKDPGSKASSTSSVTDTEETGLGANGRTVEIEPSDVAATVTTAENLEGDDAVFEDNSLSISSEEEPAISGEGGGEESKQLEESDDLQSPAVGSSEADEWASAMEGTKCEEADDSAALQTPCQNDSVAVPNAGPHFQFGETYCKKAVIASAAQWREAPTVSFESTATTSSVSEDGERPSDGSRKEHKVGLMSPEEAAVFDEIDDILNDAMDGGECSDTSHCSAQPPPLPASTPPRHVQEEEEEELSCQPPSPPLRDSPLTSTPSCSKGTPSSKGQAELPRTISFFRKQQRDATPQHGSLVATPSRASRSYAFHEEPQSSLGDRIKALQERVLSQQTVISQASQALNLCQASPEFLGSSEQVEGEKLLLIATQKRLACLNEIQRLKVEGDCPMSELPRGSLAIKKVRFPINRDALKASSGFVYHFICLVQHRDTIHVSPLRSSDTLPGADLEFDYEILFSGLDDDFQVLVDLYGLKTISPVVSHDKKYHIKKESIKMKLSSRGRKGDSNFLLPAVSSPGGPNAVRTSSFQSLGSFSLTTANCGQSAFAVSKVQGAHCLEGKAFVELKLHADHTMEHWGFLTLFEEIGGFGAWTRLWCLLKGSHLVYWKNPEEADCKPPLGSVDLRQCITREVSRLPYSECAHPNTFELVVVEPLEDRHRDTLTTTRRATVAVTRHRLSADGKEQLKTWCNAINSMLNSIRKWDLEAYKAMDVSHFL